MQRIVSQGELGGQAGTLLRKVGKVVFNLFVLMILQLAVFYHQPLGILFHQFIYMADLLLLQSEGQVELLAHCLRPHSYWLDYVPSLGEALLSFGLRGSLFWTCISF